MKKKTIIFLVLFALSAIIAVLFVVISDEYYFNSMIKNSNENKCISIKNDNGVEYLEVNNTNYLLVDNNSIAKGYFDEDTYYRLTETIVFNFDSIKKARVYTPFCKIARIKLNKESDIYCNLLSYKENEFKECGDDFYAPLGFALPEFSSDNITKLEIFVYDESDESKTVPKVILTKSDEIDSFFSDYKKYISKYTSKNSGAFECYIYYDNYTFEEQLYEENLEYLLN